jgi:hypothetical protein
VLTGLNPAGIGAKGVGLGYFQGLTALRVAPAWGSLRWVFHPCTEVD